MLQKFAEMAVASDITISIYVSENSDSSETSNLLQKNFPNIHVFRSEIRFASAEENVFYALQRIGPGIVWLFGDDDRLSFERISILFENIPKLFLDRTKAIFLHDTFVSENGAIIYSQPILSNEETRQVSAEVLISSNGILSGMAGFSNWILKINKEDLYLAHKIDFNSNAIYSHVFWILSIIKDQAVIDIQIPVIYYIKNSHDTNSSSNWRNYTKIIGKTEAYPWTINLITQLDSLIKNTIVSKELIREIIEYDKFGNQFSLVDFILHRFLEDLNNYQSSNQIQQDLDVVLKFIIENNLSLEIVQFALVDFSTNLRKSNFSSKQIQSLRLNLLKVVDSCKNRYGSTVYATFYLETLNHLVFKKKDGFFALSKSIVWSKANLEIFFTKSNSEVIHSADLSELLIKLRNQPLKVEENIPLLSIGIPTLQFLEIVRKRIPRILKVLLKKVFKY